MAIEMPILFPGNEVRLRKPGQPWEQRGTVEYIHGETAGVRWHNGDKTTSIFNRPFGRYPVVDLEQIYEDAPQS